MKIAYVNNHYQLGGAETVVRQLHEGALRTGHKSRLHVSDGKTWPRSEGLRPLYPRWLARLDHSRWRGLAQWFAPRRAWTDRAFRALATSDADIVHVHSFHGLYASMESLAAVVHAKPLVWTFHRFWGVTGGCDHPFGCTRYQNGCGDCPQVGRFAVGPVDRTAEEWRRKQQILSPLPLHIIAPSHHLAERVRGSTLGRNWTVHVIPNGVDAGTFHADRKQDSSLKTGLNLKGDKLTALFICREFKDPIKGFPVIEQVLNTSTWTGLQVALVGQNSDWARARITSGADVTDLGYISDRARLARLCEVADIFLYASDGENFPCVIIEAMAAGCCVVTTPVDGVMEQVEAGVSGFVAADHTPAALVATLRHVLAMPGLTRRETGAAACARVRAEFTEETMVRRHLELYEKLVHDFRRPA